MHLLVNSFSQSSIRPLNVYLLAFLPSSFAMYTTALACTYAFESTSSNNSRRTLISTLLFAVGGIVGWPFALALAIPFIFEELFVSGTDIVMPHMRIQWLLRRFRRLLVAGLTSSLIFVRPRLTLEMSADLFYRFQSSA